jgi:hypothetical protein
MSVWPCALLVGPLPHSPPPPVPPFIVSMWTTPLPACSYVRPVSSETATYTPSPSEAPVSDPIVKLGALKQVWLSFAASPCVGCVCVLD